MDSILALLGYGLVFVIVSGILLFVIAFKRTVDDPAIGEESDMPEIDSVAMQGWSLIYTAENNDYFMLAQVFKSDTGKTYRTILSETSSPPSIEDDSEYDSLDDAKEAADDWVNSYSSD